LHIEITSTFLLAVAYVTGLDILGTWKINKMHSITI
jgi:hypothetical protein